MTTVPRRSARLACQAARVTAPSRPVAPQEISGSNEPRYRRAPAIVAKSCEVSEASEVEKSGTAEIVPARSTQSVRRMIAHYVDLMDITRDGDLRVAYMLRMLEYILEHSDELRIIASMDFLEELETMLTRTEAKLLYRPEIAMCKKLELRLLVKNIRAALSS
jgi:hypothetical protein